MGSTYVMAKISNPKEPERSWEGKFLVDTGAIYCLVPRKHLAAIGLTPRGSRECELADGSLIRLDEAPAEIELVDGVHAGEYTLTHMLFADDDVEPLLGVLALEGFGLQVDPVNKQIGRMRLRV